MQQFTLNYDARNHELKVLIICTYRMDAVFIPT